MRGGRGATRILGTREVIRRTGTELTRTGEGTDRRGQGRRGRRGCVVNNVIRGCFPRYCRCSRLRLGEVVTSKVGSRRYRHVVRVIGGRDTRGDINITSGTRDRITKGRKANGNRGIWGRSAEFSHYTRVCRRK